MPARDLSTVPSCAPRPAGRGQGPDRLPLPRQAISHEWLTIPGGSEKVVEALLDLVPDAELLCSVYDAAPWPAKITDRPVHPTVLNRLPGAREQYPKLLPLMDAAFRHLDVTGYDLVVSSNHACAKNVRTREASSAVHVCYCHTPMRYVWDPGFLEGEQLGRAAAAAFRALLPRLRRTDLRGASQVDVFVANSSVVAERIERFYDRPATVVHPPVGVDAHLARPRAAAPDAPYLVLGRVVPYKKADVAIEACRRLGRPVVVAGSGRDLERTKAGVGPGAQVDFRGGVSDAELAELLATSRALLFPGLEDFGIVPVEAQAAGLPVIGNELGGVRDSVVDGRTGVLYTPGDDPAGALADAILRFESLSLEDADLRAHAEAFSEERFLTEMARVLLSAERRPG